MEGDRAASLQAGREALEAAHWQRAHAAFEALLADAETAEALDGLGVACWFEGEVDVGIALREQAFERYAAAGDWSTAARVGVWVSRQYLISGRTSAAAGWLARAARVVEDEPGCVGAGWVAVEQARRAGTVAAAAEGARRALALARAQGDGDLEVFALSVLGRAEVAAGIVDDGFRDLDEAMAAATAGRVRSLHTLGEAYCNLIIACTSAGDWERATEWCRHIDAFAEERGMTVLFGACRTVHADLLAASGRWDDAADALTDAIDAHRGGYPAMASAPAASLALLRIRQGRLAEAEQLLAGRDETREALVARAELLRAEGDPASAVVLLERALTSSTGDVMADARLLCPLADALLTLGETDRAQTVVARLGDLAGRSGRPLVAARAALARARLAAATDGRGDDRAAATTALQLFGRSGCRTTPPTPASSSRGRSPTTFPSWRARRRAARSRRSAAWVRVEGWMPRRRCCASSARPSAVVPGATVT